MQQQGTMETWHLADQAVSSKGQKSCQLTVDHQPVRFQMGKNLRTLFGASNFDKTVDAPRNLDFDLTDHEDVQARLREIDDWTVGYIAANSERLLKRQMSKEEVLSNYTPLVRAYGSGVSVNTKTSRTRT